MKGGGAKPRAYCVYATAAGLLGLGQQPGFFFVKFIICYKGEKKMDYELNLEDYMDKELWEQITELSRLRGSTREMLVVEALREYISRSKQIRQMTD